MLGMLGARDTRRGEERGEDARRVGEDSREAEIEGQNDDDKPLSWLLDGSRRSCCAWDARRASTSSSVASEPWLEIEVGDPCCSACPCRCISASTLMPGLVRP